MDFKQFSEKYSEIKSPKGDNSSFKDYESNSFLEYIKNDEAKSKQRYYRMFILYSIGVVAYLWIYILNPDSDLTISNRIMGLCFVIAFGVLVILSKMRYNQLSKPSFLKSSKEFLIDARQRFVFWNKQQLWMIPVILLVNVGFSFSGLNYFDNLAGTQSILTLQLIFWSVIFFAFYMGKKSWIKNKKPILTKIDKMLARFEEQ